MALYSVASRFLLTRDALEQCTCVHVSKYEIAMLLLTLSLILEFKAQFPALVLYVYVLMSYMQVMAEDLNPDKMREENQDGEGLSGLTIKDFEERWWNKLHACLLMKENLVLSRDKEMEMG